MTITKLGHCCLLIEIDGVKILTDPGSYSTIPESVVGVNAILITHDHSDHVHIETLKKVLAVNPEAKVYTNPSVAKLLKEAGIAYDILVHEGSAEIGDVVVEAVGEKHAVMHPDIPQTENTGFFIGGKLFYPGDALTNPGGPVEVLALPVAGPWLTLADAIEYAKEVKPTKCFPVHDGILKKPSSTNTVPPKVLEPLGISFKVLEEGVPTEFA